MKSEKRTGYSVALMNTNPGHSKFWRADVHGRFVVCTWGKIGTWAQQKSFQFGTPGEALEFTVKKTESKLSKGYRKAA